MSDYRRMYIPGGTYFFTVVTADRRSWLTTDAGIEAFREAYRRIVTDRPLKTVAAVVLPDHMHCIWRLPESDRDFPRRWQRIKRLTTERLKRSGMEGPFWQPRYWERLIRDEDDLRLHMDYIHYNPVRHSLVDRASEWHASSIHRYIRAGWYTPDWGVSDPEHMDARVLADGGDP